MKFIAVLVLICCSVIALADEGSPPLNEAPKATNTTEKSPVNENELEYKINEMLKQISSQVYGIENLHFRRTKCEDLSHRMGDNGRLTCKTRAIDTNIHIDRDEEIQATINLAIIVTVQNNRITRVSVEKGNARFKPANSLNIDMNSPHVVLRKIEAKLKEAYVKIVNAMNNVARRQLPMPIEIRKKGNSHDWDWD